MGTAALVGVFVAAILLITVITLVRVSRSRDETREDRQKWRAGGSAGGGDGSGGCSGGGSSCGGGGCGGGGGD